MKKLLGFLTIAILLATVFTSCKKESTDPPALWTTDVTGITETTAISGGEITSEGSASITARGVCWSTTADPTIADSKTSDGTGGGVFTSTLTGLAIETSYHVRAYATNAHGTSYGDDVVFTTPVSAVLKTIIYGDEKWEFFYKTDGKVDYFDNYWLGALDKKVTYDYSVAGKLTLTKVGASTYAVYDINADGYITKSYSQSTPGNYERYVYDANGFLIEIWVLSAPAAEIKTIGATVVDGNVSLWEKFTAGVKTQHRVFTNSPTYNSGKVHQATITDSPWKPVGNFYGKPNANMIQKFVYHNPTVTPIVYKEVPWAYEYDVKNRVTRATKTNYDLSTETWNYTYY